jgi:hypothetical protein
MGTADSGLPFHAHHSQTMSGSLFPSYERFEGARKVHKERAESTHLPPSRFAASGQLDHISTEDDPHLFMHYTHKHVSCASIIPVRRVRRATARNCACQPEQH